MPSVLIEVRKKYRQAEEIALMAAVHAALREAFRILFHDKNILERNGRWQIVAGCVSRCL